MNSFSQIYMNSDFIRKMTEGIPESERAVFIEHLQQAISKYDALAGFSSESSSIIEALTGSPASEAGQPERRLPRRR